MKDGAARYRMPAAREVTVSAVPDGGLNLSRPADEIGDGQSPEMWNMWTDGHVLTLRPGLRRVLEQEYGPILGVCPADGRSLLLKRILRDGQVLSERHGIYFVTGRAVLSWDGSTAERLPTDIRFADGRWQPEYEDLHLDRCGMISCGEYRDRLTDTAGRVWETRGDGVYLFGSGHFLTIAPQIVSWTVSPADTEVTADAVISYRTPYVPTITRDTTPLGDGKAGEALNFLTTRVCQSYTADSASTVYRMTGGTPDDQDVTVEYEDPVSGRSYFFWFPDGFPSDTQEDVTATLDRKAGTMTFDKAPNGKAGVTDNVRITYGRAGQTENPVFSCTAGSWYGGVSGQGGGSRIFLSGNPDHRNLVYYCASDNPAYFPQDAVIAVGEPTDAVVAFGQQFNILILLKEHGVYSIAGSGDGTFTVNLVHGGDGCDMPGSVQRIRNVLVWGNSRKGLFLLHSTQIKDERTVVGFSGNIDPLLLTQESGSLPAACSVDDGSHYFLFAGDRAFVWQYGDLAEKNSQLLQDGELYHFAFWNLPAAVKTAFCYDGAVYVADSGGTVGRLDRTAGDDDGEWFDAGWRSKAFDCGAPERLKQLAGLWMRLSVSQPLQVEVGCGGPAGAEKTEIPVEPGDADMTRVELFRVQARNLQVTVRRCRENRSRFAFGGLQMRALIGPSV